MPSKFTVVWFLVTIHYSFPQKIEGKKKNHASDSKTLFLTMLLTNHRPEKIPHCHKDIPH